MTEGRTLSTHDKYSIMKSLFLNLTIVYYSQDGSTDNDCFRNILGLMRKQAHELGYQLEVIRNGEDLIIRVVNDRHTLLSTELGLFTYLDEEDEEE